MDVRYEKKEENEYWIKYFAARHPRAEYHHIHGAILVFEHGLLVGIIMRKSSTKVPPKFETYAVI